ncbi:MAG: hypothetical protein DHS20C21_01170 [Gemmatimonadota bacterium]|nr:MAG: hypothetical protein DHS20C21_01170 [Gemmatimonadota bacterium]
MSQYPRHLRAPSLALAALAAGLVLAGCGEDEPTAPEQDPGPAPPSADTTSPAELIAAHAYAFSNRDLDRYAATLEAPSGRAEGFVFFPRVDDAADFLWIPETGWDYAVEVGIIGNMMNPEFVSEENGNSVDSIEMELTVTNERAIEGGGIEVTCLANILVLWSANDGLSSDTRLAFTMFPDADGFLRIRTIQELEIFRLPGRGRSEMGSWGSVKSLYRS